jgi:oxygen-independent coproporphyrinogen III oxidase
MNDISKIHVDLELLKKYDRPGPRYTSYPTAPYFHDGVGSDEYAKQIRKEQEKDIRNISVYIHIPFCDTLCYYCGCNTMITNNKQKVEQYLLYLDKEIDLLKSHLHPNQKIAQLQWGGGTPTHLSPDQIHQLGEALHKRFDFHPDIAAGVEMDPRELTREHMVALKEAGFNRCSFGVQDLDPKVQRAINRVQPVELTVRTLEWARELGFKGTNVDLIYGLPFQSVKTMESTLEQIIEINPERLAVFNYAHLPDMIKHQRLIKNEWLPSPSEKLDILKTCIEKLTGAGYIYIGMDHFAKPDDELTLALNNGTLYRNFQGYSTHAGLNLYALGITGISMLSAMYVQNYKTLDDYYIKLEKKELPVFRGIELSQDDVIRRDIITQIMCNFKVDKKAFSQKHHIVFDDYFRDSLKQLTSFE